jgi:hypothetical protein
MLVSPEPSASFRKQNDRRNHHAGHRSGPSLFPDHVPPPAEADFWRHLARQAVAGVA